MANDYERLKTDTIRKENPKKNANLFSILSFWWVGELLAIGNKRPLENEDLFPLLDEDKTQTSTEKLQRIWNDGKMSQPSNKRRNGYRLLKALFQMLSCNDYKLVVSTCLLTGVCAVLQPVFLSLLLPELINSSASLEGFQWKYIYAAGICLSSLLRVFVTHHFSYNTELMSIRWKSAVAGLIYRKVLCWSQAELLNVTSGYIINLIAGDLQRFESAVNHILTFVIQALTEMFGVSIIMFYLFGWKSLAGILFLVILSLFYGVSAKLCASLRTRISEVADQRVNIMNSIISGIRTVKMFAWEWPFVERVQRIRKQEVRLIRWKTAVLATAASLHYTCQPISVFISLVTLAASGTELTSYNTFMILSFISTLRVTITYCFAATTVAMADFWAAVTRIQTILEFDGNNIRKYLQGTFQIAGGHSSKISDTHFNDPTISLQNVVCSWTGNLEKPTLKSLCLSADRGELVFITGRVGCGKSSLLHAILKEIPLLNGKISCQGKIAWVGQLSWLFSGTLQDNILFGETFDPVRYQRALQACDLNKDLQRFPDGDMTVVGERGIVLSGGQQARVELARAVYSNADIYLLDDPLSAVDSKVGHHIFKTCINGVLHKKTRLMVTHNVEVLLNAKHIVVMEEGSVSVEGHYSSLLNSGLNVNVISNIAGKSETENMQMKKASNPERMLHEKLAGMQMDEEDRVIGSISWTLYWNYLKVGLHVTAVGAMALFFLVVQGSLVLPDWWLLRLTSRSHDPKNQSEDLYIYGALVGGAFLLSFMRAAVCLNVLLNSSIQLHNSMLSAVLKAPILFFDTNPVGRVLNRFSRDIGIMDELLPEVSLKAIQLVLFGVGSIVLPSILNAWVILPATPLVILLILIGRYYTKTSCDLRRLEGINRSPVLSHFRDTLDGLVTIRAYKREDTFIDQLYRYQDDHNRAWFAMLSTVRWLAFRLELICVVFVVFVVCLAIASHSSSGIAALSIVYALQMVLDTTQHGVRKCAEVENYMTSVERVVTYTHIQQEPGYENPSQPPENWPEHGQVKVKNLGLVYYKGGPEILKGVSFTVDSNEKVGIVGRTGAGKSSLVSALFRMPQPTGHVIIDDINTGSINIQSSRRAMSVITQNPVLFTGSLRMNLDPFDEYDDKELWDALEEASLKTMVEKLPHQLSEEIKECGANFSVGERQLLCLARALLKKDKIIVMDEATANVDYKTDQLIQETIHTKFKHCTVITIAHRLKTIIDYDRVLVLENGRIVEYDKPENLLLNEDGYFSRLYSRYGTLEL